MRRQPPWQRECSNYYDARLRRPLYHHQGRPVRKEVRIEQAVFGLRLRISNNPLFTHVPAVMVLAAGSAEAVGWKDSDMSCNKIVRCAIHPAIGIARLGNSPDEYFLGPEIPGVPAHPDDGLFKDKAGRLKRQVARFRIYGFDENGEVVKELTSEDAEIIWTVHLANKKAAWYCFNTAMDIPEAVAVARRNPTYAGDQRTGLIIDPGERSIAARNYSGPQRFDTGQFQVKTGQAVSVYLGEMRIDGDGNL